MKKILLSLIIALTALFALAGCTQLAETAQKVSDDLGDKAIDASALIDIWKIETSDSTANGSPTGKKITVIGKVSSIPVTQKAGEELKDYVDYEKTETPAWYNSDNVTKVERLRWTSNNTTELQKSLLMKLGIAPVTDVGSTSAPTTAEAAK